MVPFSIIAGAMSARLKEAAGKAVKDVYDGLFRIHKVSSNEFGFNDPWSENRDFKLKQGDGIHGNYNRRWNPYGSCGI